LYKQLVIIEISQGFVKQNKPETLTASKIRKKSGEGMLPGVFSR
jgi:hypothetical protein